MKKPAKKLHEEAKSIKKEKEVIPPDVFDDIKGVKVFISEQDVDVIEQKLGEDKKISSEKKDSDFESGENRNNTDVIEAKDENVKSQSFYEKVLGEKPPENVSDDNEEEYQQESVNKSMFFLGGIVFVLTVIIATVIGLIFISNQAKTKKDIKQKAVITISPTEVPSPTPFDKSNISFDVFNGSGEGGKAKKTADAIEALGYSIDTVGNADSSDHTGLEASFSDKLTDSEKESIIADLKKEFISVTIGTDKVSEGVDVTIIIGK